jgi:hypothetical protein
MGNDYVFISYSRHDSPFVERLAGDLRQQGIDVWIDRENIAPGQSWQQEIEHGLKKASSLIFVLSSNSIKSKWMLSELGAFWATKKRIVPVIIEDVDEAALPADISRIQWADFRQSYQTGFQSLLSGLGISISAAKPVTQKSKKTKGYAFLSYTEEDGDFVSSLKEFLKEHGYAYWDYEESDRDYHSQLFLELEGVIIEASATLSILSEAWKRSEWAVKEFFFSQEVETPVFLLRAKELGPTLAIAGMTYIDFTKDLVSGFRKLDKELKRKKL